MVGVYAVGEVEMTDDPIMISHINDFQFCPVSIYFHNLFGDADRTMYQSKYQIEGTNAHKTIDKNTYSSSNDVLTGISVYSEEYDIIGKIDIFYIKKKLLVERKKKISALFDGQIFQVYAQYFALKEMGYLIEKLRIHSMDDNKNYDLELPEDNPEMMEKFRKTISDMRSFDLELFIQTNPRKCLKCIYEPMCGVSCSGESNDVFGNI
jgi:RecB family exonuclease